MKQAVHRQGFWIAWIWAIPIAALGVVVWLGVRTLSQGGPEVVVTFTDAGGVKANDTKVTFNKMQVGQVEAVKLHKDLQAADVTLSLNSDMAGHVGPGTRFWITGQKIELSDPSTIKSLIAGPTIEMDPHDGPTQHHIQGLDQAPVLKHEPPGVQFVLHATQLGSISRGAPVYYRDLKVGEIQGYTFDAPDTFKIVAFVFEPYAKLVHVGSRFWNASAARLAMGSGGPSFSLLSPSALITGAVAFETPQTVAGAVAGNKTDFKLYDSKDDASFAPGPDAVSYHITLDDAQAVALDEGAPVNLENHRIGSVTNVGMQFQQGKLQSDVTIAVEPRLLRIANAPTGTGRAQMDAVLALLVGQGLRAQLGTTTPVVGAKDIELRFVPGVQSAELIAGSPPGIPSVPGGDITQVIRQVSDVTAKLDALPLSAIADEVHDATSRLAQLSKSPQLQQTLRHLDQSVSNIDEITQQTRGQIRPLLAQVKKAVQQADEALASAHSLIGGQGGNGPEQASMPHALYELTRAARSLRELADLLARQPDSLVFGKASRR